MNKNQFVQASAIFVVLTIAGLLMILVPYQIELDQPETVIALQNSLPLIGSAMMAAGLAFFLLEMTRLDRQKSS
jgi:drug/metabolite transporter (DMT)-like permease